MILDFNKCKELFMISRRDILKLGVLGTLTPIFQKYAYGEDLNQKDLGFFKKNTFNFNMLIEYAQELSEVRYLDNDVKLPNFLLNLSYNQYINIKYLPSYGIFGEENSNFIIQPLHRGHLFESQVKLFSVDNEYSSYIPYNKNLYDFSDINVSNEPLQEIGFSGFRIMRREDNNVLKELAIFQ